jgi:murein DD-endopeptidase MepM/ murein hydrolase activator NlpD
MREGSLALTPGQTVRVGQLVGRVGNSGRSTGAHLHFEVRVGGEPVDPLVWIPANRRT